jgi:hypothetical protein
VQPRSKKNRSKIGIGTPSSQSKMYPVAATSLIRSRSLIFFLSPLLIYQFEKSPRSACASKQNGLFIAIPTCRRMLDTPVFLVSCEQLMPKSNRVALNACAG